MAFGVDLGTTNSSVAWADPTGTVFSLKVRRGPKEPFDAVERSLVLNPLGDDPIVGHIAEGADGFLVESFKRRFEKARLRQSTYQVDTVATQEYDAVLQGVKYAESLTWVPLYYDEYSLDEVVAAGSLVLQRLLMSTEIDPDPRNQRSPASSRSVLSRLLGRARGPEGSLAGAESETTIAAEPDERLFIGVPVTFGPTARRRLFAALVSSGCFGGRPQAYRLVLERCRLVYEPLALVSTLTILESQNVLVVDYGGGTLDVALVRVDLDELGRRVKELALGGVPQAGDHLDEVFRQSLLEDRPSLRRSFEQQVAAGGADAVMARAAFAKAKVELSERPTTVMRLFGDEEITRSEFERSVSGVLDEAGAAIDDTLRRAGLTPREIGTVLLTGGSSLVPAVQERVRSRFEHLDDLSFEAGRAGDRDSERQTLTGVSRGLARFGFLESFEATAPCTFSVVVPGVSNDGIACLERGTPDTFELTASPAVRVRVAPGIRNSFALYSDLVRETYCGAVVDVEVPAGVTEVVVRVSASRERFTTAFIVMNVSGEVLGRFDLDAMSAEELHAFIDGDCEWTPTDRPSPERAFLTRPLEVGDFVEWRSNGASRRGKVVGIREIATAEQVERMRGFDPKHYVVTTAREENHRVLFGQTTRPAWEVGDVRLV